VKEVRPVIVDRHYFWFFFPPLRQVGDYKYDW